MNTSMVAGFLYFVFLSFLVLLVSWFVVHNIQYHNYCKRVKTALQIKLFHPVGLSWVKNRDASKWYFVNRYSPNEAADAIAREVHNKRRNVDEHEDNFI